VLEKIMKEKWGIYMSRNGPFYMSAKAVCENQAKITKRPYAFIRHPRYLGAYITYVSTALFMQAWVACAVSIPVLFFAFIRRIYYEEIELKRSLGGNYEHYCRTDKRFFRGFGKVLGQRLRVHMRFRPHLDIIIIIPGAFCKRK
jgi:protein-S-isoprenylcysteine O-methyltransferase Ste14